MRALDGASCRCGDLGGRRDLLILLPEKVKESIRLDNNDSNDNDNDNDSDNDNENANNSIDDYTW